MTEKSPFDPAYPSAFPDATTPVPPFQPAPKRFSRDLQNNWLGGVCSGIARYLGWDVTLVRVLFVVSCVLPGPQFLIYLLLWLVMPKD
ncbi:PspC domain-containing protein [Tsukamurella sp. 1534]|uniref:PspC domain-containing protein n=1 Tax=Tsukamurella sp. 1534 TaxID=1151061 RepID=UPI0003028E9C|nr:PspC domain-containing protein [Tsukamurella sp. 1534]